MADLETNGNYVPSLLIAASLGIWAWVLANRDSLWAPPSQAARERVSWPALPVCATFLTAFLLPLFAAVLIRQQAALDDPLSLVNVKWQCAFSVAQIVTIVGLLAIAKRPRAGDFGCDLANWPGDLLAGLTGYGASFAPVFFFIAVTYYLGWRREDDAHKLLKILESNSQGEGLFWIFLCAAVLVPLAEELLYRVLLQGWSQSQISPVRAILFSSTIFCLSHQTADVLPLVPLAVILGYVYYRRRSYLAVVVLHALFNATMLTMAVLNKS